MAEIDDLLQQLELEIATRQDQRDMRAAMAMEAAHAAAAVQLEAEREALIRVGREAERQGWLLAIELQLRHLKAGGSNAMALHALRQQMLGEP